MKTLNLTESNKTNTAVMCRRCVVDTTVPGYNFDKDGVCSYCRMYDQMEKLYPLDDRGQRKADYLISKIKNEGKGKKFDCVIGISGGRDSTYTLFKAVKEWGLRPIAVHFNDGFGNPVAGENMIKATKKLGVELKTITSDWRESKDLRISYLKASTPDLGTPTDIGIATALYGVAHQYDIKTIVIGQSFRTEGIAPLEWNYLDGKYLKAVHKLFGKHPLRKWTPNDPGFNLTMGPMIYYTVIKGIKTVPLLYHVPYIRKEADDIIKRELDWVYTGAHYYDDLYQSLMTYVMRTKFDIDRRKYNYSALIRSGQMTKDEALNLLKEVYVIEDPKVIDLCIKRLGLTRSEFDAMMALSPKTFRDYPSSYNLIKLLKWPIKFCSAVHILPSTAYLKYFECG